MPDYNVTRAIQGDRLYEPGEIITLTPKEAKELTALNAIDPKPTKAAGGAADKAAADKAAADKAAADKAAKP
jgi:hypothetical protein